MDAIAVLCQIRPELSDVWTYELADYSMPSTQNVRDNYSAVMQDLITWMTHSGCACKKCISCVHCGAHFDLGHDFVWNDDQYYEPETSCSNTSKICRLCGPGWWEAPQKYGGELRYVLSNLRARWPVQYRRGVLTLGLFDNVIAQMNMNNYLSKGRQVCVGLWTGDHSEQDAITWLGCGGAVSKNLLPRLNT